MELVVAAEHTVVLEEALKNVSGMSLQLHNHSIACLLIQGNRPPYGFKPTRFIQGNRPPFGFKPNQIQYTGRAGIPKATVRTGLSKK